MTDDRRLSLVRACASERPTLSALADFFAVRTARERTALLRDLNALWTERLLDTAGQGTFTRFFPTPKGWDYLRANARVVGGR